MLTSNAGAGQAAPPTTLFYSASGRTSNQTLKTGFNITPLEERRPNVMLRSPPPFVLSAMLRAFNDVGRAEGLPPVTMALVLIRYVAYYVSVIVTVSHRGKLRTAPVIIQADAPPFCPRCFDPSPFAYLFHPCHKMTHLTEVSKRMCCFAECPRLYS